MMDRLRAKWREDLFSTYEWQHNHRLDRPGGALDAVWLKPVPDVAPYGAVFKPTCRRCSYPAAAREKIAYDLAFEAGVPVAPVLLCDSKGRFGAEQEECCISLKTHPSTPPWSTVFTEPILQSSLGDALRQAAAEPLSRIAVFDMWIDNPDRDNLGNMVYGEDEAVPTRTSIYAFDHDLAMGGSKNLWQNGGWNSQSAVPFPKGISPLLDKTCMLHAAERIASLSDDLIRSCVERIPDRYLSQSFKTSTVEGLLGRKLSLSAFVLQLP